MLDNLASDTSGRSFKARSHRLKLKDKFKLPHGLLRHILALADAVLILLASMLGSGVYQLSANGNFAQVQQFFGAGIIAAVLYVLIGQSIGSYDLQTIFSSRKTVAQVVAKWSLVCLLLSLLAFMMKIGPAFSRGSIVCFELLALLFLLVSHRTIRRFVAIAVDDGQVQGRRAVLVGTREELASLTARELLQRFGVSEVARFQFAGDKSKNLAMSAEETATLMGVLENARDSSASGIVLALPWTDTRKLELVRDQLRSSPLPIELLPDRRIRSLVTNPSFRLMGSLAIEIQRGPLSRLEQLSKRTLDVIGASIGLLCLCPLMLLATAAIKLDSRGPVLFRQRRKGFNAKEFVILKFRTMSVMEDGPQLSQAKRHDPRVTRVGRVLRASSIDELPQLLNVFMGHMSLVGPRPHAVAHDSHYGNLLSEYAFRHHVRPGITGWAQVQGHRGGTSQVAQMKARVDCDLWYINNWSLVLDLKILMLTCFEVLRPRNAY